MTIQNAEIKRKTHTETLKVLSRGTEELNYRILQLLPAKTNEIRDRIHLSKMPFYRRIGQLSEAGLLKHDRREAILQRTELGDRLMHLVRSIEKTAQLQAEIAVSTKLRSERYRIKGNPTRA